MFLSLLLYPDAVEAAVWELDKKAGAHIVSAVTQELLHDAWQDRLDAADKCISTLEELAKTTRLEKVVLGLPTAYLTREGDILHEIRSPLKNITSSLGLVPIGFVSIYQAIIHKLKNDEGVPPSVILLGLSSNVITVHLYRVGTLVGEEVVPLQAGLAEHLEDALLRLNDGGILPSRMLLYGTKRTDLEGVKREVLKHPWTKGNQFLHFPKVEILPGDGAAVSVSFAGSAELAHDIDDETTTENETVVAQATSPIPEMKEEEEDALPEEKQAPEVLRSTVTPTESEDDVEDDEDDDVLDDVVKNEDEEDPLDEEDVEEDDTEEKEEDEDDAENPVDFKKPPVTKTDLENEPEEKNDAVEEDEKEEDKSHHANVIAVDPSALGFEQEDGEEEEYAIEEEQRKSHAARHERKKIVVPSFVSGLKSKFQKHESEEHALQTPDTLEEEKAGPKLPMKLLPVIILLIVLLSGAYFLFTNVLPKATVQIVIAPKTVTKSSTMIVDPSISQVSSDTQKIPGIKKEDKQSGDKTVPASGTKTVGDPASGTLTLFNKSETGKSFPIGTTFLTGSLGFKSTEDVSIASASESLDQGTVTYGKATVKVTAKVIGTDGNIGAGKSFTVSGVSSDLVSGRNDAAFTGGTSQSVTVVSKADQDAIVKALTSDLTDKVKQSFQAGQAAETLIPDTIKTQVDERVFSAEVGAQSKDVNGKVTVSISGIAYKKDDISTLLLQFINQDVPQGYRVDSARMNISVSDPKIAKDGTIKIDATGTATAVPNIAVSQLMNQLAGKSKAAATEMIKQLPGVSDVTINVTSSLFSSQLPVHAQRISIVTKETQ